MPSTAEVVRQANLELRRRELFAKYPDAVLVKNWILDQCKALKVKPGAVKKRIAKGQLQPRIIELSSKERYVV